MKKWLRDKLACMLARLMRHVALDPRYFELWEKNGFHVTQVHFYSPLPDTRELSEECFSRRTEMTGISIASGPQLDLLEGFRNRFSREYASFPSQARAGTPRFHFGNISFESVDAEILYCMIRRHHPEKFIEIGSGYSTLLATEALKRNADEGNCCELLAIEPYPPGFLKEKLPVAVRLLKQPVQSVPMEEFLRLGSGDILFIDSSHVLKTGSDVQFEFLEVLPRLASGVLVHVHDVFLPLEYPRQWVKDRHRFWNEQYLLQAFLCGNADFEVLWAGSWMNTYHPDALSKAFPSFQPGHTQPASFWIRKR